MENYLATVFGDVGNERSMFLLLSLTVEEILWQTGFMDHEINITRNLALEKLHRGKTLKEYVAL